MSEKEPISWPTAKGDPIMPVWSYGDKKGMYEAKALRAFARDLIERIKELELPVRVAMKAAGGDGLDTMAYCRMLQKRLEGMTRERDRFQAGVKMLENINAALGARLRAATETCERPSAWYRVVRSPDTPMGPSETDVELAWGDWPPGEPDDVVWQPLYSRPAQLPPDDLDVRDALVRLRTVELACDARDDRQSVTYIAQVAALLRRMPAPPPGDSDGEKWRRLVSMYLDSDFPVKSAIQYVRAAATKCEGQS